MSLENWAKYKQHCGFLAGTPQCNSVVGLFTLFYYQIDDILIQKSSPVFQLYEKIMFNT